MARVEFEHVYKRFNKVEVVHDINLDIKDKEFLVLVGPSGCGKSTCLRMVAGLEEVSEGDIYIGDKVVNNVDPKDRDIAMVFQNYALYPHMTVYDNMAFGLKLRHIPAQEIKKRVENAADILGLQKLLQRKPKELSGGQRQRVARVAHSCALLRCSCWMSRSRTWMPSCACRRARRSRRSTSVYRPPLSMSPMTRRKP